MPRIIGSLIFLIAVVASATQALAQTNKLWQPGTFTDGDSWRPPCNDCYVQQIEEVVPGTGVPVSGNPTCGVQEVVDFGKLAAAAVKAYIDPETGSGNLSEAAKKYAYQNLRNRVGGDFQNFLDANGPRTPYGTCAPMIAMLPQGAQIVTAHLGAWDDNVGVFGCPQPPGECSQGWSKFMSPPTPQMQDGLLIVTTSFMNWAHDRDRVARLFIAYRLPPGALPPIPLS